MKKKEYNYSGCIYACEFVQASSVKWMVKTKVMKKYLNLPNCITGIRLVGAVALFFVPPLALPFYIIYTLCGVSDAIDGMVARATGCSTDFGARLDSIADLTFYTAMLVRLLPKLQEVFPGWLWYHVVLLITLRLAGYLVAALRYKKFASLHTYMNKATGASMFAVPYFLPTPYGAAYCIGVGVVALIAVLEELTMHLTSKAYTPGRKTILMKPPVQSSEH